ncbi:MAG: hypothetical protein E5Y32_07995 [Mesorhizobium sp.]|uniref:hypothetical protein n=1 Tax=Mesorhizobium sp. TaxID=1871066 RepID=UPI0012225F59|nr:hypothetical protein [Mesorhizobium sp.]TIM08952.1 MAG: hypothetical protein E5Y67_28030 [Mesorhizobium sp.]TIN47053.1 MAG: hypothetical protein E5Y32_07995 [Mesorhizobium sp.]
MVLDTRAKQVADEHHGIVVIGAGFDSAFFLHQFVGRRKARVPFGLWRHSTRDWQLERGANSNIRDEDAGRSWNYTIGLVGGTNSWFGQTPRLLAYDFDRPTSYDDLEPFCCGPGGHAGEQLCQGEKIL